jgi:ABC-2 type transport system ATP-binding protein
VAEANEALERLLGALSQRGIELAGVEVRRPTLDDAFLELTGRALRDA